MSTRLIKGNKLPLCFGVYVLFYKYLFRHPEFISGSYIKNFFEKIAKQSWILFHEKQSLISQPLSFAMFFVTSDWVHYRSLGVLHKIRSSG